MRTHITLLFLILSLSTIGQSCRISGTVTDSKKEPLIGATVFVNGNGLATDIDGRYTITLKKGIYNFAASYIGMKTKKMDNVKCQKDSVIIDFGMEENATEIKNLEIVSYRKPLISTTESRIETSVSKDGIKERGASAITDLAATPSGVSHSDAGGSLTIRGAREDETSYVISSHKATDKTTAAPSKKMHAEEKSATYYKSDATSVAAHAGVLTSGEINDFSKWKMWSDLSKGEFEEHSAHWGFHAQHRYMTEVTNSGGFPICGASATLIDSKGTAVWKAMTDNTGKAELWAGMFDNPAIVSSSSYSIKVTYREQEKIVKKASEFSKGTNRVTLQTDCGASDVVDIVFTVDATGSMGDEINYLKTELLDVIRKAKNNNHSLSYKLGSVFYRDHGDTYLTKFSQLDPDINKTYEFISQQSAGGGGDFPEAVDEALKVTLDDIKWDENARAKIVFLILDAPPHDDVATRQKLDALIRKAAEKGVRIVPLACSGVDKSTEYILRSFALATNGTYTFLTDHSGVGGPHIAPSTDKYKVEHMNDLILRLILRYSYYPDCDSYTKKEQKELINKTDSIFTIADSTQSQSTDVLDEPLSESEFAENVKIYPNPTRGPLTIQVKGNVTELFLTDISGKILERYQSAKGERKQINIGDNAAGIYFVRYLKNDHWKAGKIVLLKN